MSTKSSAKKFYCTMNHVTPAGWVYSSHNRKNKCIFTPNPCFISEYRIDFHPSLPPPTPLLSVCIPVLEFPWCGSRVRFAAGWDYTVAENSCGLHLLYRQGSYTSVALLRVKFKSEWNESRIGVLLYGRKKKINGYSNL